MLNSSVFIVSARLSSRLLTAVFALVGLTQAVTAQNAGQVPSKPPTSSDLQAAGLDPIPFTVEAFGLTVNLPAAATTAAEKANEQLVISITDNASLPTWSMRIFQWNSVLEQPVSLAQMVEGLADLNDETQQQKVIHNQAHRCGEIEGRLCYVERKTATNQTYTAGWLVLPTTERTFLVLTVQTLPEHFPRVKPIFEACFDTINLRSVEELASERLQRLEAGRAFIQSVTPEQLKSLAGLSQWMRLYTPATAEGKGEVERGYSRFEVREARKGELNPSRGVNSYDADARKPGIMIHVAARLVINKERNTFYDSETRYWMAWDQSEEAWSILGTYRQGEAEQTQAETGVRTPAERGVAPRLSVIIADNARNTREEHDWAVPDVYLSQTIGWVLGKLLPKDVKAEKEYSYYFYNFAGASPAVTQRTDIWRPAKDGSGHFQLISKMSSDSKPITSIYAKDGSLVRRVHPDGTVTEPSTIEDLRRHWKRAGLPLGPSGR